MHLRELLFVTRFERLQLVRLLQQLVPLHCRQRLGRLRLRVQRGSQRCQLALELFHLGLQRVNLDLVALRTFFVVPALRFHLPYKISLRMDRLFELRDGRLRVLLLRVRQQLLLATERLIIQTLLELTDEIF